MTGLYSCHKTDKKLYELIRVLGDAVSKLDTFVRILNHISRSITWSLLALKASYLVKGPTSTWSFMWWCQFIDWLKFKTRPSSLLNFGTANWNFDSVINSNSEPFSLNNPKVLFIFFTVDYFELGYLEHSPISEWVFVSLGLASIPVFISNSVGRTLGRSRK